MDEQTALEEVRRAGRQVRDETRWYGIFCLILAAGFSGYVVLSHLVGPSHVAVGVLLVGLLGVLLALWAWSGRGQRAVSQVQARFDVVMGVASLLLLGVALLVRSWVVPPGFSAGLVLVALLPALPCAVGAAAVLRR